MRTCTAHIRSVSSYSQSAPHETPKLNKETADAWEARTWMNRAHATPDGQVFIPPMALKMALDKAAKMLGTQIPGKARATYTKHFESGVMVVEPPLLGITRDQMRGNRLFVNSTGVRGTGKRVWKTFPTVDTWKAVATFTVLADEIPPHVFKETLDYAGLFVGIGQFRPEVGGYFGRFEAEKLVWS